MQLARRAKTGDQAFWRARAKEAIDRARALEDPQKRLSLLRTAEIYDKIAARIGRGPLS
jgi:hypothetical protein